MTAVRRLAAILAVDVVGCSRLMGEDEAGTATRVREHREAARPMVASLGGRVVKTMGDGLLLEFPSVVERGAGADCFSPDSDRSATSPVSYARSCSFSRRRNRWILPVAVLGSSSTNSIARGYL